METGKMIDTDTILQDIEQEEQLNRMDDMNRDTNPYQEVIVNNAKKIEPLMMHMEQWSILSNILNYIQHDRHHTVNDILNIKAVNKYRNKSETKKEKEPAELDFGSMSLKLHKEYLVVYEGIQSEIVNTTRFNENSRLEYKIFG